MTFNTYKISTFLKHLKNTIGVNSETIRRGPLYFALNKIYLEWILVFKANLLVIKIE